MEVTIGVLKYKNWDEEWLNQQINQTSSEEYINKSNS